MNSRHLYFYIHYCNHKTFFPHALQTGKIERTITHHELILFLNGRGVLSMQGKKYPVKSGSLFYLMPDVLYTLEFDKETAVQILSVHFSYAHVRLKDGNWDVKNALLPLWPHVTVALTDYHHIADVFLKLTDIWNEKLPGYEFMTQNLLGQLLIAISQYTKKEESNHAASLKVEKMIGYMQQNLKCHISLHEFSDLVSLSPFYLTKIFKKETGYSIMEYFNRIKMDKAKELLAEGSWKVKEVAKEIGFSDEFYFSRLFKKIEGMSPSEYYRNIIHEV